MAWVLITDGVNDSCSLTKVTIPSGEDFTFRFIFEVTADTQGYQVGEAGAFNNAISLRHTTSTVSRFRASGLNTVLTHSSAIATGVLHDWELQRTSGTVDLVDTATQVSLLTSTQVNDNAFLFDEFFLWANNSNFFSGKTQLIQLTSASNNLRWSATDSSHAAGAVTLTETTTGNDAIGSDFPTDGSAWEDLGGGGGGGVTVTVTLGAINYSSQDTVISLTGSVDIATTLGTISYTSQDASISITGSEDITAGIGHINYTSQPATIQLTGVIDVVPTLGSISYTSRNTTISITGSEDVSATLGAITYSSNNTTVSLISQIDISATLGAINYTTNDVAVTLLGTVEISATLGAIVYNSYSVSVSIGEGQVIGNVTTSFVNDIYSSDFKPNTITVNFK